MPHFAKVVDIVQPYDKDVMLSNYTVYVPYLPCPPLLPALLLELYYARFSLDLHMHSSPPLAGKARGRAPRPGCLVFHIYNVFPLHLLSAFKSVCHDYQLQHLLLDLNCARFSQNLHKSHSLPPVGRKHRETQGAVERSSIIA